MTEGVEPTTGVEQTTGVCDHHHHHMARGLTRSYGSVQAVRGIDLVIAPGV